MTELFIIKSTDYSWDKLVNKLKWYDLAILCFYILTVVQASDKASKLMGEYTS
jgi:hypothetical protein